MSLAVSKSVTGKNRLNKRETTAGSWRKLRYDEGEPALRQLRNEKGLLVYRLTATATGEPGVHGIEVPSNLIFSEHLSYDWLFNMLPMCLYL